MLAPLHLSASHAGPLLLVTGVAAVVFGLLGYLLGKGDFGPASG